MKGKAIIFSAPSGAGKTTIVKHLVKLDLGLEFSVSACSRPPRGKEVDGKDYHFMDAGTFRQKIGENAFIEWEEVYKDHFYGTLKSEADRIWSNGHHAVFDVDVKGGINLKNYFRSNALSVFVQAPSLEELERRLRARSTDSEKDIRKRIAKSIVEMESARRFDIRLINDDLRETLSEAERIVRDFLE